MSQLPEILNVKPFSDVSNMSIKTEILDPITISDTQCIFQVPKAATLDQGSFVQLAVVCNSGKTGSAFFPIQTGIHSLISSVFLKIGNQVIASNTNYAYHQTMMRQFKTPDSRAHIDMVKVGTCGDRFGFTGASSRLTPRDMEFTTSGTEVNVSLKVPSFILPTDDESTTPVFAVSLADLLPAFNSRQLPLYALKEHMYLEINFNTQTKDADAGVICATVDGATGVTISPSKKNIKFCYDALYYDDEKTQNLLSVAQSPEGLVMVYEDLITTLATVAAQATGTQIIERELALAGRTVRNLMISEKNAGEKTVTQGQYISRDTVQPAALNFRVNDNRVYDRDLVLPTRKYNELTLARGLPLMVPNQFYSYDVDLDKTAGDLNQTSVFIGKIMDHQMVAADGTDRFTDVDMRATCHYEGLDMTLDNENRLGNGQKIGAKPIRLLKSYQRQATDAAAREIRVFASVERVMVIRNGVVEVTA